MPVAVSPAVEIKVNSGSYVTAVGGVNVAAGDVVTIRLVSTNVDSWYCQCISTDDLSDKDAINAGATPDPVAHTLTFTVPAGSPGRTFRFESVVNGMLTQQRLDSSLRTTFALYVLTTGGRRVLAADEQLESDPVFGYIASVNALIRNPSPGSGEANLSANVGDGADVFRDKVGVTFNFRGIKGLNGLSAAVNADNVEIDSSGIKGANVGDGADVFRDRTTDTFNFRGIKGVGGLSAVVSGDNVEISGAALNQCCNVMDYGAFATGISDDGPGFRAAIEAARVAGHNKVCVPPGTYYFGTSYKAGRYTAVLITEPTQIIGIGGARAGSQGVRITVAAGLTGFAAYAGKAAEGGTGADGWSLRGIDIRSAGASSVVAYAPSTAYTVGQLIKPNSLIQLGVADTGGNKHLYEVIRAGTTAADVETVAIAAEPHTPDRCTPWTANTAIKAGTIVRSTDGSGTKWNVFFIAQNDGTTHATTEPTWNFTPSATTSDNGITWECLTNPNILVMGTVVCRVVAFCGVISMARGLFDDCRFVDFQNAGLMVEGNASTPIIDADANGTVVFNCDFLPPFAGGGNKGLGLYFRGGEMRGSAVIGCRFISRVATNQGNVALPTDGTQHQHGLLDGSTFGVQVIGCTANGGFTGFDYWFAGSSSEGVAIGCHSNIGRCRFDSSSSAIGLQGGVLWSILGGPKSFSTTSTAITKDGLKHAVEVSPDGLKVAGLNGGNTGPFHYTTDLVDTGDIGQYPLSGWLYHAWASSSYAAWAIANRQVATHANAPRGREGGEMLLPNGTDFGPASDSIGVFSNLNEYIGSQSFNRRGGYRRVGDIVMRPDRAAAGAFAADVVVTAGHEGPVWTANTAKLAKVNPGSGSAHLASVVAPTDPNNHRRFVCTVAGTTHATTEPAGFATAPTPGVSTVSDGTVTWLYIGDAPVRQPTWFAGANAGSEWIDIPLTTTTNAEVKPLSAVDISGYDDGVYTFDYEIRAVCRLDVGLTAACSYKLRDSVVVISGAVVDNVTTWLESVSVEGSIDPALLEVFDGSNIAGLQITGVAGYLINWSGRYKVNGTIDLDSGPTGVTPVAPDVIFGSNLKRWYKENYTAATGVWVDETGTYNTSQSGSGRRPASSTINSHTCVSFDGTDDGLVAGTGTAPFSTACTIFGVLQTSSLVGTAYLWAKTYGGAALGIGATLGHSHLLEAWINSSSSPAPADSDALVDDNTPHVFVMRWNGATVELWVDDVLQATTQTKASPLNTTSDLLSLGSAIFTSDGTHDYHYGGKLGNTGLADRAATDDEIHSLSAYLAAWAGV